MHNRYNLDVSIQAHDSDERRRLFTVRVMWVTVFFSPEDYGKFWNLSCERMDHFFGLLIMSARQMATKRQ